MAHIRVEHIIPASAGDLWADITDIASHVEWMSDAASITFLTKQRSGVGTRIEVVTKIGPMFTTDLMEFTEWTAPRRMAIRHQGLITGVGVFTLHDSGPHTRFVWEEELTFPLHLGGRLGGALARPALKAIWRKNLRNLAARY